MNLTICYPTMRKHPKLNWLLDSLGYQLKKHPELVIQLIVVDYWKDLRDLFTEYEQFVFPADLDVLHITPLPSNVQGKHRLTSEIWYAAANARNTGFVYAKYDHIAFTDDLAVLGEHWLEGVIESIEGNYIALGAYQKHYNMVVENGRVVSSELRDDGRDSRAGMCGENEKIQTRGNLFYGCSCCIPLEAMLKINGFDCLTDTIRYEDTIGGVRLQNDGNIFFYDRRMFSIESNDHPQYDFVVKSEDTMLGAEKYRLLLDKFGIKESMYPAEANKDVSHILVEIGHQLPPKAVWNFFSLYELREKVKRGEEITLEDMKYPEKRWFEV